MVFRISKFGNCFLILLCVTEYAWQIPDPLENTALMRSTRIFRHCRVCPFSTKTAYSILHF